MLCRHMIFFFFYSSIGSFEDKTVDAGFLQINILLLERHLEMYATVDVCTHRGLLLCTSYEETESPGKVSTNNEM